MVPKNCRASNERHLDKGKCILSSSNKSELFKTLVVEPTETWCKQVSITGVLWAI